MSAQGVKETLALFGGIVRSQRKQLGISQEELASRSGLHRTYITDIERGARNVTMDSMTRIARALDVPLSQLIAQIERSKDQKVSPPSNEFRSTYPPVFSPVSILLVEDNPKHAELTLHALEKGGVGNNVLVVNSGEEALELLLSERGKARPRMPLRPEMILLDLTLPGLSGLEVLRRLRADPRTNEIPVIVLTASRSDQDLKECMELGVKGYIGKPVDFFEFSTIVPKLGFRWLLMENR